MTLLMKCNTCNETDLIHRKDGKTWVCPYCEFIDKMNIPSFVNLQKVLYREDVVKDNGVVEVKYPELEKMN